VVGKNEEEVNLGTNEHSGPSKHMPIKNLFFWVRSSAAAALS
jgi:hypothetical protein